MKIRYGWGQRMKISHVSISTPLWLVGDSSPFPRDTIFEFLSPNERDFLLGMLPELGF